MQNYVTVIKKARANKAHIAVFVIGLLLLTAGLLTAYHTISFNSDDAAQKLMLHQTTEARQINIFTPPDNFVLKLPINLLVNWLVASPNKNLFISAWLMNALGLLMFFVVGLYFVRKYTTDSKAQWVFWLAFLLLCANSSSTFLYDIRSPQIRTIEIGFAFVVLWGVDKILEGRKTAYTKKSAVYASLLAIFTGLLLYSDPAFEVFLLVPIIIVACLSYSRIGKNGLLRLAAFAAGAVVSYAIFGKIGTSIGVHTYQVPSDFVAWEKLGSNFAIAAQGLLSLQDAMIFGLPLFKASTLLVSANLVLLIVAAIYIPRKLAAERDYWLVFFAFEPVFLFFAYFMSSNVINVATSRYLILLPFYLVIIMAIGFYRYWGKRDARVMIAVISALFLMCVGQVGINAHVLWRNRHSNPNAYTEQVVSAIESLHITKGYATYWNAGVSSFYANYTADVFPINCEPTAIEPYYWNVNEAAFDKLSQKSFIIVSNSRAHPGSDIESADQTSLCTDRSAIKQFGQPANVVRVTGYTEIFTYDYDLLTKMPKRVNLQTP